MRNTLACLVAVAAGAFSIAACAGGTGTSTTTGGGGKTPTGCKLADVGDPSMPIQLELVALGVDNVSVPIQDGSMVPLITPPQGGRVIFIGARATNLSPCSVFLTGSLRDATSGKITLDSRTVNLKPTADGYGASIDTNISTSANIAICPNSWSARDAYNNPYDLTLQITDKSGRSASKTISVVPYCAEPGSLMTECTCTCKVGYVLGSPCP